MPEGVHPARRWARCPEICVSAVCSALPPFGSRAIASQRGRWSGLGGPVGPPLRSAAGRRSSGSAAEMCATTCFGIAATRLEPRVGQSRRARRRRASDANGRLGRGEVLLLNLLDQLAPVDRHAPRRGEAQANLIAAHAHDDDLDVVANSDPLTRSSGQHKHLQRPRPVPICVS